MTGWPTVCPGTAANVTCLRTRAALIKVREQLDPPAAVLQDASCRITIYMGSL